MTMISAKDARQAAEKVMKEKRAGELTEGLKHVSEQIRSMMLKGGMVVRFPSLAPEVVSHLRGLGYVVDREPGTGRDSREGGDYTVSWDKAE